MKIFSSEESNRNEKFSHDCSNTPSSAVHTWKMENRHMDTMLSYREREKARDSAREQSDERATVCNSLTLI